MKNKLNRKGQFFIIAALIIATIITGLGIIGNSIIVAPKPVVKSDVNNEMDREATASANYVLYKEGYNNFSEYDVMENLSKDYVDYSRTKVFNSNYIFVYATPKEVAVYGFGDKNQMDVRYNSTGTVFILADVAGDLVKARVLRADIVLNVTFYGKQYQFDLPIDSRKFYHIVRMNEGGSTYVF